MKLCSMRRSASERWLGSEACFWYSRQNSISVLVARPMSTTTLPTSVSRLDERPRALLSDCDDMWAAGDATARSGRATSAGAVGAMISQAQQVQSLRLLFTVVRDIARAGCAS